MHEFPLTKDLPPFEGDAIAQIWLDPWGVRFLFENGPNLFAEYRIEHMEPGGTVWSYDCKAENGPPLVLHRLLYKRIVAFEREDFRLIFRIDGGATLIIISEDGQYESGHVRIGDRFDVF